MKNKITRLLVKTTLLTGLLAILGFLCLFILIVSSPRSSETITTYVEKQLSAISPNFNVKIETSSIAWDGWDRAFSIRASNVKILNDTEDVIASFPRITLGLNLINTLTGQAFFSDLIIEKPTIWVNTTENIDEFVKPQNNGDFYKVIISRFLGNGKDKKLPINIIRIKNADLYIRNEHNELVWNLEEGYLRLEGDDEIVTMEASIYFSDSKKTYVKITTPAVKNGLIYPEIELKNFPSYAISDLYPNIEALDNIKFEVNGNFQTSYNIESKQLDALNFAITDTSGLLKNGSFLPPNLSFSHAEIAGRINNNFTDISLNSLSLKIDDIIIAGSLKVKNHAPDWKTISPDVQSDIQIQNIALNKLNNYWPEGVGQKTRKWLTDNFKAGLATKGSLKLDLNHEDIANNSLQKDAIDANLQFEKLNLTVHNKLPAQIKNAKGEAQFNAEEISIKVKSAEVLNSKINKGLIRFPKLNPEDARIEIFADFEGRAEEQIKLAMPYIEKTLKEKKVNLDKVTGTAHSELSLAFPLKPDLTPNEISFEVNSKLTNFFAEKINENIDVKNANLQLLTSNNQTKFSGKGSFNDVEIDLVYDVTKDSTYKKISGSFEPNDLSKFGYTHIPYIHGKMDIDFETKEDNKKLIVSGKVDARDVRITIPELGYTKEDEKIINISFNTNHDKSLKIPPIFNISAKGSDIDIKGKAAFDENKKGVILADFSKIKFGRNDLALLYENANNSTQVAISGNSLDLSESKIAKLLTSDHEEDIQKTAIKVKLDKIFMKNNQALNEVNFDLNCDKDLCKTMNLYGRFKDDSFIAASFKPIGGSRSLLVEADNAGNALRAFDIYTHLNDGTLEIQSLTKRENNNSKTEGTLTVSKFKLVNTPVLGKLLTVASFKGITDLMGGKGISFDMFEAPFKMDEGIIEIESAKTSGSSIGLTANGFINTNIGTLDLQGEIIPAATLNKMIGYIPLIGNIITGGDGEGLIATSYTLKGHYSDAEVKINPLSIITPGFLRKIFNFSKPSREIKKEEIQGPKNEGEK